MVASILAKKKTLRRDARADRHSPVGPTSRRCVTIGRGGAPGRALPRGCRSAIEPCNVEIVITEVRGPIWPRHWAAAGGARRPRGVRAREAKARRRICARRHSTWRPGCSKWVGAVAGERRLSCGARHALDSGAAAAAFDTHRDGARPARRCRRRPAYRCGRARHRPMGGSARSTAGRSRGSRTGWGRPANAAAGVRRVRTLGDVVVRRGEPLFEIHAQSATQLEFARAYAAAHPAIVRFGF